MAEAVDLPATFLSRTDVRYEPELWRDRQRLEAALTDADGLIVRNQTQVDAALLEHAPSLRVIGRLGAGLDNVDYAAASKREVAVVYTPDANTNAVVEYCIGSVINAVRTLPGAAAHVSDGGWDRRAFIGREIRELTFAIIGHGRTGSGFASFLRGRGARVLVVTRRPQSVPGEYETVSLDEAFAASDFVSLHLPGGPSTHNLIGAAQLASLPDGAWLMNISRGTVVDEIALADALDTGRLSGAILDVRLTEPPTVDRLSRHPLVVPTPHIAAFTLAAQNQVAEDVADDVLRVLGDLQPRYPAP